MAHPVKSGSQTKHAARQRTGTTPRKGSIVRGALFLLIPLLILAAAVARGLPEPHDGAVPDWNPADTTAVAH